MKRRKAQPVTESSRPYDIIGAISRYECGNIQYDEMLILFQHLVNTGLAWKLQGHYGRTAATLLRCGDITAPILPCRHCGQPCTPDNASTIHRSCTGFGEYAKQTGRTS